MRRLGFSAGLATALTLAAFLASGTGWAAPAAVGAPAETAASPGSAPIVLAQREGWHPLSPLFRLFRGGRQAAPPRQRQLQERAPAPRRTIRTAPVVPQVVEAPKDENARKVLVVGDALAEGLARGLKDAYADTPEVAIDSLISRSHGLVRESNPDWPTQIAEAIAAGRADVVVVLLGSDDRRRITLDGKRANFRSSEWEEVYRTVVERTVAAVREARVPLVWVGLPPASGPQRRSDFTYLNDFYKEKVETADGIFVDLWEAFLTEEGKYTSFGADVDGQRQRLRTGDGLLFTWPGYRKVAFFVQQNLARILGEGPALDLAFPGNDADLMLLSGGASREDVLAGAEISPALPADGSLQHRLIVEGRALPRVEGRVDDFTLPQ